MGYKAKAEQLLPKDVLKAFREVISAHNKDSANGKNKRAGSLTRKKRQETIEMGIAELWQLGFEIRKPKNFSESHMRTLAKHWEEQGQKPSTIQNKIYIFRVFVNQWLNKPNTIKESTLYVSNPDSVRRQYIATEDKSWEAHGIDIDTILEQALEIDPWVGMQLKLDDAFGLRGNESIHFNPFQDYQAEANGITVWRGTKGGRFRFVPIIHPYQLDVIMEARRLVKSKTSDMRRPGHSDKQATNRYTVVLRKLGITKKQLGVTAHGLRHGYANRRIFELTGRLSPIQGGQVGELDQETLRQSELDVANEMGHGRKSSTSAYTGSFGHALRNAPKTPEELERVRNNKPRLDWKSWGTSINAEVKVKNQSESVKDTGGESGQDSSDEDPAVA